MTNKINNYIRPEDSEPEMEIFLLRLVPGLAEQWQGADEQDIDALTKIAGRPLPNFYRWFLSRMGKKYGAIGS